MARLILSTVLVASGIYASSMTSMLGALTKVSAILDFSAMIKDTEEKLKKKFAHKPEIIKGNIEAIKTAYETVKGEG